jgi:short-subunit dehydrogenase
MTSTGSTAPAGAEEDLLRRRRGETVLITGALSGIGRELARLFAGDGADLVLIARSEGRLRELAGELAADYGVTAQVVPADLSRPGSPDQIVETLAQRQTDVDVLVNNAGFGARGPVAGIGVQRQLEMIEVNVAALTRLTALLLPGMLERRRGGILNVASTAAFQPGPNSAVYYATKAYVLSFTKALAEEVRGSGVRVSCLAPGPTDTGFAAQAGAAGSRLFRRGVMDAGRVARAGHEGLRRGKSLLENWPAGRDASGCSWSKCGVSLTATQYPWYSLGCRIQRDARSLACRSILLPIVMSTQPLSPAWWRAGAARAGSPAAPAPAVTPRT